MLLSETQQQPSLWSTVLPVFTLVLGWALASLTEFWKNMRDSVAKALERREARIIRRNEFQRENLQALSEGATELLDVTVEAYRAEMLRQQGQLSTVPSQIDIDRLYFKSNALCKMLVERVENVGVQERAKKFQKYCADANELFPDKDSARKAVTYATTHHNALLEMIGEALTQLNALDDQIG